LVFECVTNRHNSLKIVFNRVLC